jgi:uncharacterized protein with HEPN domain/predicted nucleotidyltransferase
MQADIAEKRDALAALCRQYGVRRLEVFGSAARGTDFDPDRSDADFLVTFAPAARNDLAAFTGLKGALENLLGRPVDLIEREAIEKSRNYIRRRAILRDVEAVSGWIARARRGAPARHATRGGDAQSFVAGLDEAAFLASRLHQSAAIRALEVLGAAGKVSPATQAGHPEIPWREITGMRHRLIHDYDEVRLDLVWMVVRDRLPPLIVQLAALIPDENESS